MECIPEFWKMLVPWIKWESRAKRPPQPSWLPLGSHSFPETPLFFTQLPWPPLSTNWLLLWFRCPKWLPQPWIHLAFTLDCNHQWGASLWVLFKFQERIWLAKAIQATQVISGGPTYTLAVLGSHGHCWSNQPWLEREGVESLLTDDGNFRFPGLWSGSFLQKARWLREPISISSSFNLRFLRAEMLSLREPASWDLSKRDRNRAVYMSVFYNIYLELENNYAKD